MRRKRQILVLSQQIGLRVLLRLFFKRMGHSIEIVTTRTEAMSIIEYQKERPDLLILDLHLSEESGLKLASHVRVLHPELPMLLIPSRLPSYLVPQEDIHAAAQLGIPILGKDTGLGGHNFYSLIHTLLDRV